MKHAGIPINPIMNYLPASKCGHTDHELQVGTSASTRTNIDLVLLPSLAKPGSLGRKEIVLGIQESRFLLKPTSGRFPHGFHLSSSLEDVE